jgi:hypothetical protein
MRKVLWIIPLLIAAVLAPNTYAQTYTVDFTGVLTCNDTTPCGGSSTYTVTGSYVYDATTKSLGAFSFVTPIGTIASSSNSYTFVEDFGGNFNLTFYGDFPGGPGGEGSPSNSTFLNLAFPLGDTSALGSIVIGPFNFGSDVCQLDSGASCPVLDTAAFFSFTSGTATAVTPEPGTLAFSLLGIGFVLLVMGKRSAPGL